MKNLDGYRFDLGTKEIKGREWFVARGYRLTPKGNLPEKVVFAYRFKTEAQRDQYVDTYIRNVEANRASAATRKAAKVSAKKELVNPFKIGDLFNDTWGWEQTNQDFYQVTGVGPKSVKIRQIAGKYVRATGWASEVVVADKDNFIGEEVTKVIQVLSDGRPYIKSRHGWITPTTETEEHHATHYA